MQFGRVLKELWMAWLLIIVSPMSSAMAQPDVLQDSEQCGKAQTVAECGTALPACERVLAFLARVPGNPKVDAINGRALSQSAWCENQLGRYALAEGHYRSALALRQRIRGSEHRDVATSLNNLAGVLTSQGKYEQAEKLYRQGLQMMQKLLGPAHPDVATGLNNLAYVLCLQGKYEQAEKLYQQALQMRQRLLGTVHPDVANSLNNLAGVLDRQGKYEQAEKLYRQALKMRQQLLAAEHPDVATSLNNLAYVLCRQGKYEQAEKLYRQALQMRQKLLGAEHPDVATSLNNLADVLERQGKYAQEEKLDQQALQMRQKLLGTEHPDVATSLNNLAYVLSRQGEYEQAEKLYRQALQIRQKLLGAEHPDVASSLNNLADVLSRQGKYEQAEKLYRQGLQMSQKLLGAEHPDVASSLNNLAEVLDHQGKYEQAELLLRQGLSMRQKLLGAAHPDVAISLNNLAGVLDSQGKYEEAVKLYRQALQMSQKLLGAEHLHVADSLNNVASVLSRQGKYEEAEKRYRQALQMSQKLLGAEHPDVADRLNNLAGVLMRRGQFPAALPLFTKAAQSQEKLLRGTSSETRMQTALGQVRGSEDALYGLLLRQPNDENLKRLVMTTALLRKGRAAEAGTMANRLLHQSRNNPWIKERFERWVQVRQQRELLLYGSGGNLSPVAYQERLSELSQFADDMESQLAAAMPALRHFQPPKFDDILAAVAARLPKGGALIEIVWVRPYNHKAKLTEDPWTTPHYLALVMTADQQIAVRDLGEAATMDSQVQALLASLRNPAMEPTKNAKALYERVLKRVLPEAVKQVYLSLDGALNLVPFDALHDGTDYLLGRKSFHYLTSGRDLLRTDSTESKQAALLLADPDFGRALAVQGTDKSETFYRRLAGLTRLPGAQEESKQIGALLHVAPIVARAAKESVVRAARAPWVLHIASHGLFLTGRDLPRSGGRGGALFGNPFENPFTQRKGVFIGDIGSEAMGMSGDTDSLSRSALVLADAAQGESAKSAAEDGLLTAEEARSLDLFGTQLVVLSACDTGQGELSVGQGVYGLRRAFLVAGAETLVTSLWQVSDSATGKLMEKYYQKLLKEKKGRLEGMQETMKEMREKYKHPYYWAPFLVIGSDGPLRPPASLARR